MPTGTKKDFVADAGNELEHPDDGEIAGNGSDDDGDDFGRAGGK